MLKQTNIKMPAILPVDNTKYKCLSLFLFPFFLRSLNWERENIQLQYLGKLEGENGFKVYLSFWRVSSESIFFFYGLPGFCTAWLKGTLSSCPIMFLLFPVVSTTVSIHLVTPTAVLKPGSASSPGAVVTVPTPLVTPTSVLTTAFFIPISADEKGASGFRVLANHLASFFFLHPVRRFVRTTISIHPCEVMEYR